MVFEHVDFGIIWKICNPHSDFFIFTSDLLKYYRNNTQVSLISGNNLFPNVSIDPISTNSYFFSYGHIWGWATWKDRWPYPFFYYLEDLSTRDIVKAIQHVPSLSIFAKAYYLSLFLAVKKKKVNSWAIEFLFLRMISGTLTANPASCNLVGNNGFNHSGTHTHHQPTNMITSIFSHLKKPLVHPVEVKIACNYVDLLASTLSFKSLLYHSLLYLLWK